MVCSAAAHKVTFLNTDKHIHQKFVFTVTHQDAVDERHMSTKFGRQVKNRFSFQMDAWLMQSEYWL